MLQKDLLDNRDTFPVVGFCHQRILAEAIANAAHGEGLVLKQDPRVRY
jgi:hypothetical protein